MSVLITGGTGTIGSRIAEKLLATGETVVLVDVAPGEERIRALAEEHSDRLVLRRGDVLAFGDIGAAVGEYAADTIIHLAYSLGSESNANPQAASNVNIVGTVNVLELAKLLNVRRVLVASSIAVYGDDSMYRPDELPLREDVALHIARQLPVYGAGKVYMEKICGHYAREYGLEIAGLRPSIVYGLGRRTGATGWLSNLIEAPVRGRTAAVGFGNARLSVVYVEDVAEQFIALLKAPAARFEQRRFFNTGGETCTVRDIAATVRKLIPDASLEISNGQETNLYGLAASVSDRSMEEVIGHHRRIASLEDGIRAYVNETKAHAPAMGV